MTAARTPVPRSSTIRSWSAARARVGARYRAVLDSFRTLASAGSRYPSDLPEAADVAMITLCPEWARRAAAAWCCPGRPACLPAIPGRHPGNVGQPAGPVRQAEDPQHVGCVCGNRPGGQGEGSGHRLSVCHRRAGCLQQRSGIDMTSGRGQHAEYDEPHGGGGSVDLKLDHHTRDGIEIVDVEGEIDVYTAPRLRELLIELVNNEYYQLVVNMEKVEFLDSTGLGVLVGGLKRVRAHDGSLDLVCTQERILKIFRITGLTKVFGIHDSVDEAIAARKAEK